MPVEVEKAQKHANVLQDRWAKKVAKLETAESKIAALRQDLDTSKSALTDRDKQIAALASGHKAVQLKLDQSRRQIEDLQASLSDRMAKFKEFQSLARERATELKALQTQLKRAAPGGGRSSRPRSGRSKS
jgi:peptidoglycan hydrolase CwlO-like protein